MGKSKSKCNLIFSLRRVEGAVNCCLYSWIAISGKWQVNQGENVCKLLPYYKRRKQIAYKCVSLNHFPKFPLANYQDGVLALVLYCALLSDNVPWKMPLKFWFLIHFKRKRDLCQVFLLTFLCQLLQLFYNSLTTEVTLGVTNCCLLLHNN